MNPYTVLDVPVDATSDAIKKAWRAKSKLNHSDVGGSDAAQVEINLAYEILTDPAKRQHFDETGSTDPRTPSPQSELLNLIAGVVERIENPETTDVLKMVKQIIEANQRSYAEQAHTARMAAGKFSVAAKRITAPGMTVNKAAELLMARSDAYAEQAKQADMQKEFGVRLLSLLEVYRYEVNPPAEIKTSALTFSHLLAAARYGSNWDT